MKKILEWGVTAVIFLLPWQTVWIIQEQMIGPQGAIGVWQYGTLKVYAIEFLIVALAFLAVLHTLKKMVSSPNFAKNVTFQNSDLTPFFFIAFLFFSGLSITWSGDKLVALFAWVRLLERASLFFLIRSFPIRWALVFGAWIVAALAQSVLGVWQFAAQEVVANKFLGIAAHQPFTLGDAVVEAGDRRWLRAYGAFPHPNMLGAYLAVSLAVCAGTLSYLKEKWQWLIVILASQVLLIALLLTFSRSAWLAVGVAAVIGCFAAIHSRYRYTLKRSNGQRLGNLQPHVATARARAAITPTVMLVLISMITATIFVFGFREEIQTRVGFSQSRLEVQSISERIGGIGRATPLLKEYLLFGTGIGNFTNTLFRFEESRGVVQPWYTYQPLHNVFLMIFAELGLLGIVLLLMIVVFAIRNIRSSSLRAVSYLPTGQASGLLIILFIFSLFDHFLWTHPFGLFFAAITLGVFAKTQMWYNKMR
ncbi:MAG: O-antigen ligase family protein [Patescibacteria group bacterium]